MPNHIIWLITSLNHTPHIHTRTHTQTPTPTHPHTHYVSVHTVSLSLSLLVGGRNFGVGELDTICRVCVCVHIYIYNSWDGGRAGFLDVGVHYQFVPSVPPPWDCYVTDSVTGGRGMLITVQPPRRVPSFPLHCSPGSFFYLGGYLRSRSTVHQVAFSPGQTM